jgi:hypothetical protein
MGSGSIGYLHRDVRASGQARPRAVSSEARRFVASQSRLTLLASAGPAVAEPRYTVEQLADGVQVVIYDPNVDVDGNTLIVVNDDVFVVDSCRRRVGS